MVGFLYFYFVQLESELFYFRHERLAVSCDPTMRTVYESDDYLAESIVHDLIPESI